MELNTTNIILAFITVLSFVWSYFSEQNRIVAVILGFVLLLIIILTAQDKKIESIEKEQRRLEEKLKIYEQLINIKADIKELQRRK
jgi:hypothetical protein